jgi:hypothetical protein
MKCVNIKTSEGSAQFDCPHCGVEGVIDDASIVELWAHFSGQVTCPPPQGCNQQYEIPTIEEVEQLRASGGVPEVAPQSQPADSGTGEEVASPGTTGDSESTDTKEPEEEEEPEAPKFTGPWRPKSQSDEEDSLSVEEEFEKYVSSKDGEKTKVASPLSIRTFRRMECIIQGQNKFDEIVSTFLGEIGKENVISVTPFTYMEKGEDWTDYGVIVYYSQPATKETEPEKKKSEPVAWRD